MVDSPFLQNTDIMYVNTNLHYVEVQMIGHDQMVKCP
jgi:hypothetical protein